MNWSYFSDDWSSERQPHYHPGNGCVGVGLQGNSWGPQPLRTPRFVFLFWFISSEPSFGFISSHKRLQISSFLFHTFPLSSRVGSILEAIAVTLEGHVSNLTAEVAGVVDVVIRFGMDEHIDTQQLPFILSGGGGKQIKEGEQRYI